MWLSNELREEVFDRIEKKFLTRTWKLELDTNLDGYGMLVPPENTIYINPLLNQSDDEYYTTLAYEILRWLYPKWDEDDIEDVGLQLSEDRDFRLLMDNEFGIYRELMNNG